MFNLWQNGSQGREGLWPDESENGGRKTSQPSTLRVLARPGEGLACSQHAVNVTTYNWPPTTTTPQLDLPRPKLLLKLENLPSVNLQHTLPMTLDPGSGAYLLLPRGETGWGGCLPLPPSQTPLDHLPAAPMPPAGPTFLGHPALSAKLTHQ